MICQSARSNHVGSFRCNRAPWTVGWGGQNRRLALGPPPRCSHCRPASRARFLTTAEPFVGVADATAIRAALRTSMLARSGGQLGKQRNGQALARLETLGNGAGLSASLASRAVFMQLLGMNMDEALRIPDFLGAECIASELSQEHDARTAAEWLLGPSAAEAQRYTLLFVPLEGPTGKMRMDETSGSSMSLKGPIRSSVLRFRDRASGEADERWLEFRAAAAWAGGALEAILIGPWLLSRETVERNDHALPTAHSLESCDEAQSAKLGPTAVIHHRDCKASTRNLPPSSSLEWVHSSFFACRIRHAMP